ncbi:MAG: hypothetical protein WB930_02610 [Syntrophobacteraceae bacterium]
MEYLEIAKLVFQIAFWSIIATIAILTYRRARSTILQPIRTEVFKAQLGELTHIMALFVGKNELELREAFVFEKLLYANTCSMYDSYAAIFFDVDIDRKKRPYNIQDCPHSRFNKDYAAKHLVVMQGYIRQESPPSKVDKTDPRIRAAMWSEFTYGELRIPSEFSEMEERLGLFLETPVLPTRCITLIEEYNKLVSCNLEMIGKILDDAAKEMIAKYPSLEALNQASFDWIRKMYINEFINLKPKAEEIISYVRSYYRVDDVMSV